MKKFILDNIFRSKIFVARSKIYLLPRVFPKLLSVYEPRASLTLNVTLVRKRFSAPSLISFIVPWLDGSFRSLSHFYIKVGSRDELNEFSGAVQRSLARGATNS